jgi:hypothetical protein
VARDFTADAEENAAKALESFYSAALAGKKKLLTSSVEYDVPSLIDAALQDSGLVGREQAHAAPSVSGADGSVDYGALAPEAFEKISDPQRTHPYDRKNA